MLGFELAETWADLQRFVHTPGVREISLQAALQDVLLVGGAGGALAGVACRPPPALRHPAESRRRARATLHIHT